MAWLCACMHACTCKPNTKARRQRARAVLRLGETTPEGTPTLRMRWHGCARARMRALTNTTPKERSNSRAFLRLGETTPKGYADVAHVLAWLCACAHACTCAQRPRFLFSAAAAAERKYAHGPSPREKSLADVGASPATHTQATRTQRQTTGDALDQPFSVPLPKLRATCVVKMSPKGEDSDATTMRVYRPAGRV